MNKADRWVIADWPAPGNVHALTTTRTGGYSKGPFSSFNLADHVGDDLETVNKNRNLLKEELELPSDPVWLHQVHGNKVLDVSNYGPKNKTADACISQLSATVCAVMTADCLPVLMCSKDGKKVAAVHAGWRGLVSGVLENTVLALGDSGLMVWLGPAIGSAAFEVGNDVRQAFLFQSRDFEPAFKVHKKDKWMADLYQLASIRLIKLGIEAIYGGGLCTFSDSDKFYSFRRDKETGRMASLIWRN